MADAAAAIVSLSGTRHREGVRSLDDIFSGLSRSSFRRRFRLPEKERAYLDSKGMETVMAHGRDFIERRLAPACPTNDGKQTPMRGHPIFVAQHATATCCRSCLAKWHGIDGGNPLRETEKTHVLAALERWLREQLRT